MDGMYCEASVKKGNSVKLIALKVLVVLAILFTFFFAGTTGSKLLFALGLIAACLTVWFWPRFNIELEYIFVDGQIDFDTISGGEKRKTRLRIDFEQVEIVAPKGSHSLDAFKHYKVRDFSSGKSDAKVYVIVAAVGENGLEQIYFEPSEKMVAMMKEKAPRKVMSV